MSNSPRKFAAFDIDGTIFRSGLYREVSLELINMGVLPQNVIEETTNKLTDWQHRVHENAFEEFEMVLTTYLDQELSHLKVADYERAAEQVFTTKSDNVYVYTRELIKKLKSEGYYLIAISGSQVELVEPFAQKYGFDTWIGQEWERGGEYFTGNITKTHTGKDKILARIIDEQNLTLDDSWAVGDSNGDVGMLSMVEHPIAFCPTHELYEKAKANSWKIVIERKNVIYELEPKNGSYVLAETNAR